MEKRTKKLQNMKELKEISNRKNRILERAGFKIEKIRAEKKISKEDAAKVLKLSEEQYEEVLYNKRKLRYRQVVDFCNQFSVSIGYFLDLYHDKYATIGSRLSFLRKNAAYTQKEVATVLDISTSYYCRFEKGQELPGVDKLLLLCALYGVSMDYITGISSALAHEDDLLIQGEQQTAVRIRSMYYNMVNSIKKDMQELNAGMEALSNRYIEECDTLKNQLSSVQSLINGIANKD